MGLFGEIWAEIKVSAVEFYSAGKDAKDSPGGWQHPKSMPEERFKQLNLFLRIRLGCLIAAATVAIGVISMVRYASPSLLINAAFAAPGAIFISISNSFTAWWWVIKKKGGSSEVIWGWKNWLGKWVVLLLAVTGALTVVLGAWGVVTTLLHLPVLLAGGNVSATVFSAVGVIVTIPSLLLEGYLCAYMFYNNPYPVGGAASAGDSRGRDAEKKPDGAARGRNASPAPVTSKKPEGGTELKTD